LAAFLTVFRTGRLAIRFAAALRTGLRAREATRRAVAAAFGAGFLRADFLRAAIMELLVAERRV
jgi:hypothetical protein